MHAPYSSAPSRWMMPRRCRYSRPVPTSTAMASRRRQVSFAAAAPLSRAATRQSYRLPRLQNSASRRWGHEAQLLMPVTPAPAATDSGSLQNGNGVPVISAGGTATNPMNWTTLQRVAGVWHCAFRCHAHGEVHAFVQRAAHAHSLGVAHVAHDRRLGLQVAHHFVRQLQLAARNFI